MKKSEIWAEAQKIVIEVVSNHNIEFKKDKSSIVQEKLIKALKTLLGPKNESRTHEHPDYICDETKEIMHYCTWHKIYEKVTGFNTKNATAVNECKVAIVHWNKYAQDIKKLEKTLSIVLDDALNEKITMLEAKDKRNQLVINIEELKNARSDKIDYVEAKDKAKTTNDIKNAQLEK